MLVREGVVRLLSRVRRRRDRRRRRRPAATARGRRRHRARRRAHRHPHAADRHRRGHPGRGTSCASATRASASSCSRSTSSRRTRSSCSTADRRARLPAQGAGVRRRPADRRDPRGRRRRIGHRPARWSRRWSTRAAARRDSPLEHLTPREREVLAEMAQGRNNAARRGGAGAVRARRREAHQLAVLEARPQRGADVHRRVKAVLLYLADRDTV